jgi:hypothetical protein
MPKYHRNYSGAGIVADFRRLLTTGDIGKLTRHGLKVVVA